MTRAGTLAIVAVVIAASRFGQAVERATVYGWTARGALGVTAYAAAWLVMHLIYRAQ